CSCMGLAHYYRERGDYPQAIDFYQQAISLNPRDKLLAVVLLAETYVKNGQVDKANELINKTLIANPEFQEILYSFKRQR
ncbi:MAG: tetratricopeptide repeat protein, partial [Acidobacteriota bacterium]